MLALFNRHLAQPLLAWKAGSPHLRHLRTLEQTQYDLPDVIRARQLDAVREVVRHAWLTVPYYRARWKAAGLRAEAIRSLDDLRQLPILSKADVRTHPDELRSEAYRGAAVISKTTSGSTGVPPTIV